MKNVRHFLKYILTFFVTMLFFMGLLLLSATIPKSSIKQNVLDSAKYLCDGKLFGEKLDGIDGSRIDRYADSILIGILYQYDSEHPLTSVMWSAYYHSDLENENQNLLAAAENDLGANYQYLRYWHGSIAIVRPLMTFLNLKQIYILNGILLILVAKLEPNIAVSSGEQS